MTVAAIAPVVSYVGNGVTTVFSVPFKFFAASDLSVKRTVGAVTATLSLNVDFAVSGAGSDAGGSLTLPLALASGATLTIRRRTQRSQLTDLGSQFSFYPQTHEDAFDRNMAATQDLAQDFDDYKVEVAALVGAGGNGSAPNDLYLELADNQAALDVGGSNKIRLRSSEGVAQLSEGYVRGGMWRGLGQNVFRIADYGSKSVGTLSTDSTSAFQAVMNAALTPRADNAGVASGVVQLEAGIYKLTALTPFIGKPGITIEGAGRRATVLYWDGTDGDDVLRFVNMQHLLIRNLTIELNPAKTAGIVINSKRDNAQPGNAITANSIETITINALSGAGRFVKGIALTGDDANNSEWQFRDVTIYGHATATEACFSSENSQVRANEFWGCAFVQAKRGVATYMGPSGQGGDFVWHGGSVSAMSKANFAIGRPAQRIGIYNITSEGSARFLTCWDPDTQSPSGYAGTFPIHIKGCQWSAEAKAPDGYFITYQSDAGLVVEDNTFGIANDQSSSPNVLPKIALYSAGTGYAARITGNNWIAFNSSSADPYVQLGGQAPLPIVYGNNYVRASTGNTQRRVDVLGVAQPTNMNLVREGTKRAANPSFSIGASNCTANSTSQTFAIALPTGVRIKGAYLHAYGKAAGAGVTTARLGLTSGGQELILARRIDEIDNRVVGTVPEELGPTLASLCQGGDAFFRVFDPASTVYLTLQGTTNLGNGTTTNLSALSLFVYLDLERFEVFPF